MFVGYARVSTQDQDPALQIAALEAAGCERVFIEKASGAQRDRPELKAALQYLRGGDVLMVWKLDRLARSLPQLIETVADLASKEIGFRCLTAAIDTTTPEGRLFFHMVGAFAEFERDIIRERTRAGLAAAKALGKVGGRPPKLNPDDLKAARALLADPSITVEDVARRLRVSPSTLYKHIPAARSSVAELA